MIRHNDSMRQIRMVRSNHSSQAVNCLARTARQLPTSASGTHLFFSSRRRRRHRREELAKMRNRCMAFHSRVHHMAQCQRCLQAHCNTGRTSKHKECNDSSSNQRSIQRSAAVICTAWVNHKSSRAQRHLHTSKSRSTGSGRTLHLGHWPPNSEDHRPLNTTLQVKVARLPLPRPTLQRSIYSLSISKLATHNLGRQHQIHIPVPWPTRPNPELMLHMRSNLSKFSNLNNNLNMPASSHPDRWTKHSTTISHAAAPSLRLPGTGRCVMSARSCYRSRNIC